MRTQVGRFVLEEAVARGASAEVFRARDEVTDERVAIKLFMAGSGADVSERERQLLEEANHRALIEVVGYGTTQDRRWIATRWLDGRTLAHLCATEGPLSIERTARILGDVAGALDHLADLGVVHGDVSPSNVMVDVNDRATVIDLGLARPVLADETAHAGVIGTPRYLAPEVARGERALAPADQYALGLIAYEAVTGQWPFPETQEPMAMLRHQIDSQPIPPSEHDPSLAGTVDDAIMKALDKDPMRRHRSSRALVAELDAVGQPLLRAVKNDAFAPKTSADRTPRVFFVALAALAVIAAAASAIYITSRDGDDGAVTGASSEESAAQLPGTRCNLLVVSTFDDDIAADQYYQGPDLDTGRVTRGLGQEGTAGLLLGGGELDGRYGELVEVVAGERYVFGAFVSSAAGAAGELIVTFLDADTTPIGDEADDVTADIPGDFSGRIEVSSTAPPDAVFAVPTVAAQVGPAVTIDNLAFAAAGCES